MKILITDDEAPARDRLRRLIGEIEGAEVVGEAPNGKACLLLSDRLAPDVVLLDIRMPGIDGLEAAMHLAAWEQPPAVIFTTAYGDHALAAFEADAVDYLVKPIRRERLAQALARAGSLNRAQLAAVRGSGGDETARTHICARVRGSMALIPLEEVVYFRADHKYVVVRHEGGEVLIEEPLKALEREFGERFLRVHRNTLVARSYLGGMERDADGGWRIVLRAVDDRPEVSRRHVAGVREVLKDTSGPRAPGLSKTG